MGAIAAAAGVATLVLGFDGLGHAKIGMTVPEVEKALEVKLSTTEEPPPGSSATEWAEFNGCHHVWNAKALPGIQFMVTKGKVVRIEVDAGAYRTSKGAGLKTTEAQLRRLYPEIRVEPHFYDPAGHYFRLESRDRKYAILFETDGVSVTSFRSGYVEPVGYVEGCL